MRTVAVMYPKILDVGCFSDTLDHVGQKFSTPILARFINNWISLFSHSPRARLLWKGRTGKNPKTYSATRWWSKWEVMGDDLFLSYPDIQPFLFENEDLATATREKLLTI